MSATRVRVGNPLTVSTTRAHARARRMPQSGLGLQLGGIMPPACLGDSLGRRRAPRDASDTPRGLGDSLGRRRAPRDASNAPRARGMPYFLLQWEERNERCPLASGNCLCPSPRQGNARTRQGWPSLCTFASRRPRERPHAPGLARRGRRREHPAEGTPARAPGLVPGPASPRLSATPGGTRTRTLIHRTRTAHKGAIPPLCAAPCFLIPFLVRDTEKERGQDPRGTRRTGHSCCTA